MTTFLAFPRARLANNVVSGNETATTTGSVVLSHAGTC